MTAKLRLDVIGALICAVAGAFAMVNGRAEVGWLALIAANQFLTRDAIRQGRRP